MERMVIAVLAFACVSSCKVRLCMCLSSCVLVSVPMREPAPAAHACWLGQPSQPDALPAFSDAGPTQSSGAADSSMEDIPTRPKSTLPMRARARRVCLSTETTLS